MSGRVVDVASTGDAGPSVKAAGQILGEVLHTTRQDAESINGMIRLNLMQKIDHRPLFMYTRCGP